MAGIRIEGNTSGNVVEVAGNNQLKIIPETNANSNAANIGGVRVYSEVDQGLSTGIPFLLSGEVSNEYRARVESDIIHDEESFVYSAQNFTKHAMYATTFVPSWTTTGFQTNPTSSLTAAAAMLLKTYKTFGVIGTETLSLDMEAAITFASGSQLPANIVIEFGFGLNATSTPYDCFDGTYIRITPAGTYLIIRNNSTTDTAISNLLTAPDGSLTNVWQPVSGRKYQFILYAMTRSVELWISDPVTGTTWLAADVNTPPGYGSPFASPSTSVFVRQYQVSAPTVAAQITIGRYSVRRGGQNYSVMPAAFAARALDGIYSPGTLTTTANQTITSGSITRPAAAAPTNTAALVTSLSGIVLETGTLAVGTDGILMAFQCPPPPTTTGTTYVPLRRLRIDGIRIASAVQTAFTAGGFAKFFYIAYGSTSVSLAGVAADTVTTKAYRRVQLDLCQAYTATQAAGTLPVVTGGGGTSNIQNQFYVNPGEYIALCTYHIGTAGVTGVIQHAISFDYAWE